MDDFIMAAIEVVRGQLRLPAGRWTHVEVFGSAGWLTVYGGASPVSVGFFENEVSVSHVMQRFHYEDPEFSGKVARAVDALLEWRVVDDHQ